MKQLKRNGFTLIECLLALMICAIVSFCGMVFLESCAKIVTIQPYQQNQFTILQLRQMCSVAHNLKVEDGKLSMVYERQLIELSYHNHRLVQRDGYVIWMEHLDSAHFEKEEKDIYLYWSYQNEMVKSQIY